MDMLSEPEETAAALARLSCLLLDDRELARCLSWVVTSVVQLVPRAMCCALSVDHDGHSVTQCASHPLARQLDQLQCETGDGPGLQALRTGELVLVDVMAEEPRWPTLAAAVSQRGVGSALAVPILVRGRPMGVLSLYAAASHTFGPVESTLAQLFASQAATALAAALRHVDRAQLSGDLRSALASRSLVDLATGIIMAQRRCPAPEAFATLRALSARRNIELAPAAAQVISAATGPAAVPPRRRLPRRTVP